MSDHHTARITPPVWTWRDGETSIRASWAVLNGTPDLDIEHRVTLLVYVRSLTDRNLQKNYTRVWLSAQECALRIGAPAGAVRWHLQNLQTADYLWNATSLRAQAREVYDLAPTMARMELLEGFAAGRVLPFVRGERVR